ncbi:amino acid permease [Pseudomonas sp. Irchel s3h17]|uniref:amino acid permease n=1 Tax=Pseudomonas sp. Irchel s3h17 TaxID=2009182 RepID=UPI000BA2E506|nr:amino acid permease [Pseudomonas sp. Irchel s3h17]
MRGELKRSLKNRHLQLIALGGAVGTGLFLGSAGALKSAGPSIILGYAICGFIAFMIMRQLGEMIVEEPVAGSFSHFAHKYWGGFAGFLSGWNCWILYILVGMSELTAVGKYVHYWWPEIPTWVSAAVFFVLINAINLTNVKIFGEAEFWFAIIKVLAVIGMIAMGSYLLVSGNAGPQASLSNLWQHGGFFPHGLSGLAMSMAIIMLSFGGLEMLGFTAAEAEKPRTMIPKAINQVIYRILIFYIGVLVVLLSLVVATLVINWAMISLSHVKFRQHMNRTRQKPLFKALWYPYGNYVCLAFLVFILGVMLMDPVIRISVYAIPVWIALMWVCYGIKHKRSVSQDLYGEA